MPTQIEKAEAYASHFLDGAISLHEKFAILEPMLVNDTVRQGFGSGQRARGFSLLSGSLAMSCIQDLVKLALDKDDRAPSAANLLRMLSDESLRNELRERFAVWGVPSARDYSDDPEVVAALEHMEARDELKRRGKFDELYSELQSKWNELSTSTAFSSFKRARDKISAHTEIRFVADKYRPLTLAELGVNRLDLESAIASLQEIVELISLLVRNASFAWDMLNDQLSRAADAFWTLPVQRPPAV
jgi:hypothetical protein